MMQITVNFRDGTKRILPDPNARVSQAGEWRTRFGDGVVQVEDPTGLVYSWPLDLVRDVQEVPRPRF